ncbi:hypothetical protein [Variibacter gotjawalensis]|nr:hypothetical protein [Variibacter gotjawalensis]NIK46855.1 hypothetical protein [Variibacter gotjawalensis]
MRILTCGLVVLAMATAPALAQNPPSVLGTQPIGPPMNPNQVIQQQNRPQNLPPAMAPQPYEFRNPSSGPMPQVNPYSGSSPRARESSRQRYNCAQKAKGMSRGKRDAYIRGCMDG